MTEKSGLFDRRLLLGILFICMSGMALGGLARRLGVPVIVNSHYLPLRLLALRGDLHS